MSATSPNLDAPKGKPLTGWHVLGIMVAFFAVVIAVDAVFLNLAITTHPGEVSKTAYEDGLAYNKTLVNQSRQQALGWRVQVGQAEAGKVRIRFLDRQDQLVKGLALKARLVRPATEQGATDLVFQEVEPGVYVSGGAERSGAYDLLLETKGSNGVPFKAERRLIWR